MSKGVGITIDDRQFRKDLRRVEKRIGNLKPFFEVVGSLVVASVQTNFEVGGRPERWRPLKARTVKGQFLAGNSTRTRKRRIRSQAGRPTKSYSTFVLGKKVLIGTGRLMRSINYRASRRQVTIGTNLVYAAIHHFGGQAGRGRKTTIPARPYMLIQREDVPSIRAELAKFIEEGK